MIISNKDKAREIVDNWVAKGGKGYPSLEPKLVDAIASALAESRQDAIAVAKQYRQFFRAENFSDRERALRVGAATVIIDALSEGLEISPEQAEAEPSQPGD